MNDKIIKLSDNFLTNSGWLLSWKQNQCVDQNGDFLPWYNYSIIDFLKQKLNKNISVFEFGCGYSTLFYAKYCKKVVSVEKKSEWVQRINGLVNLNKIINVKIILNYSAFAQSINLSEEKFDLIVIDSIARIECSIESYNKLTNDGVAILDNSEREKYKDIFAFFTNKGFKELTFCGIGSLRCDVSYTTIFYRSDNIFNL